MIADDLYPRPTREEIAARYRAPDGRALCACGHDQGAHMAGGPRPCVTASCGCGRWRPAAPSPQPAPPAIVQGAVEPEPAPDPLACFAVHLSARMRALGWDQARLQERAGISDRAAAKAINGTGCDLAVAGKLAAAVGGYLAAMIGPYSCGTCAGEPPAGFGCLECGAETRAS